MNKGLGAACRFEIWGGQYEEYGEYQMSLKILAQMLARISTFSLIRAEKLSPKEIPSNGFG